jgi:hypothetical protein
MKLDKGWSRGAFKTQGARLDRRLMVLLLPRSCQQLVAAAAAPQCPVVLESWGFQELKVQDWTGD